MINRFYSSDCISLEECEKRINENNKFPRRIALWPRYGEIEYDINSNYFRTDEVKESRDVLIIGCSITAGVGIHEHQMYANNWCRENNYTFYNLAFPGAGFETLYRVLEEYIDIVRPKIVLCCYPFTNERREVRYPHKDMIVHPYHFQNIIKGDDRSLMNKNRSVLRELFHEQEIAIMRRRTLNAIRWLCHSKNTQLIEFDGPQTLGNDEGARDACHPSDKMNERYLTKLRDETRNKN